jgi:hypothetical protein
MARQNPLSWRRREWPQAKTIPYTLVLFVVAALLLSAVVTFKVMQWHYSEHLDYLKQQVDNLRGTKPSSAPLPNAVTPPPTPTRLADQSNPQLRETAEKFAASLMEYSQAYDIQERKISDREWAERGALENDLQA